MSSEEVVVKLEDVWKIYSLGEVQVEALRGVNLEIKEEEFMAVVGPSGSGKSTFLNMIGCLDVPTRGRIFLEGKDITSYSEDELATLRAKRIGFVFQRFNLFQNLTALQNVTLPMVFAGDHIENREKRAKELLTEVGLEERMTHEPSELSGGEQQRVALARSLANDPDIIVADEPTGNLDSKTGEKIMGVFEKLHKVEKKTIIIVTHDPTIAEYSKNDIILKDGKIVSNHKVQKKAVW